MKNKQHGWLVSVYIDTQPEAVDTQFFDNYDAACEFKSKSLNEIDDAVVATLDEVDYDPDTGDYE